MKALFYLLDGDSNASSYHRVLQYIPLLREYGIEARVSRPVPRVVYERLVERGGAGGGGNGRADSRLIGKLAFYGLFALCRTLDVQRAHNADVVVIQRDLFPFGPPVLERALFRRNPHLVYDTDDATYLRPSFTPTTPFQRLRRFDKVAEVVRHARWVSVATEPIAAWAREYNQHVSVVPMAVDLRVYDAFARGRGLSSIAGLHGTQAHRGSAAHSGGTAEHRGSSGLAGGAAGPTSGPGQGGGAAGHTSGLEHGGTTAGHAGSAGLGGSAGRGDSDAPYTSGPGRGGGAAGHDESGAEHPRGLEQGGAAGHGFSGAASDYSARLVLGWAGTAGGIGYLDRLRPALAAVADAEHVVVRVVSGGYRRVQLPGVPLEAGPWRGLQDLADFDIGLLPLDDSPFERAKFPFKLLQYWALRIPVVSARVGVAAEVIEDGINGLLASSAEEWQAALCRLIGDPALRKRLGEAGRETVASRYTIERVGPLLAEGLLAAAR